MMIISVGYSACHWCHVMERESFEKEDVAKILNEHFVCIKVDREERPEVDQQYMLATHALSGRGGWPNSVWLTPEGKPWMAGTYFPRKQFKEALTRLSNLWKDRNRDVLKQADQLAAAVEQMGAPKLDQKPISIGLLTANTSAALKRFDENHGGFGSKPKFPPHANLAFLIDQYQTNETKDAKVLLAIDTTLTKMSLGGVYDQVGGGFHRYSTDEQWLLPHFEKMLYDQAQLLESIARACWITPDDHYIERIFSTIFYLDDRLAAPNGGYYAAEDADSEGEEGKFYVWRPDEIRAVLDGVEADLVLERYGVTEDGNFEDRRTVLSISRSIDDLGSSHGLTTLQVRDLLESARTKLYTEREERIRPIRDEKIVSAWNGLLLSGLAHATRTTGDPAILDRATNLAAFIDGNLIDRTNVVRHIIGGLRGPSGVLEDYAFLARGFLDLYNVTIETAYLRQACALVNSAIDRFADDEGGGFFLSDGQDPLLPLRTKGDHDGAEPSGNSIMAIVLLRLYRLLGIDEYRSRAERTWRLFARRVADVPHAMPMMAIAGRLVVSAPESIVIVADDSETGSTTMLAELQRDKQSYGKVILLTSDENGAWLRSISPHLAGMTTIEGAATLYHCRNFTCERPRTSVKDGAE